ncbi:MAG: GNAT family N-acetyltransferase [Chloroflexales bacterium]|nr:GNAT family N-acetyltransferase [Chloroflexales bacterium]
MIAIVTTRPAHLQALAAHQQRCFPGVDPSDWIREEHFASHLHLFPAGQHVALDGNTVVGQSSTFRISGASALAPHTYRSICADNTFANHDPQGAWLYGADMSIHPAYRGQGLASRLYTARKELIRRLNLRGMVAGGMLPGYARYHDTLSIEEYARRVASGELSDATLTPQLRNGFVLRGMLPNYLHDAHYGADATLIVWENPDWNVEAL